MRYIELKPVRAGMVVYPSDYPWPSNHGNAPGQANAWLLPHGDYLALDVTPAARQRAYRALVRHALEPAMLDDIRATCRPGRHWVITGFVPALNRFCSAASGMPGVAGL